MLTIIIGLAIGAVAGVTANKIMKTKSSNLAIDCLVGMFGGAIGIGLFNLLGFKVTNILAELVSAVVGSVIIIYVKQWIIKKINR